MFGADDVTCTTVESTDDVALLDDDDSFAGGTMITVSEVPEPTYTCLPNA